MSTTAKRLPVLMMALLIGSVSAAPMQASKKDSTLTLVQVEYAFARTVQQDGIRNGFLQYLDDQAIAFAPQPTSAKAFYLTRKAAPSTLSWYPAMARLAASGDFGFTTGPWQVHFVRRDGKPGEIHGNYVTLWHRNADGQWRWILDAGVPYHAPELKPAALPDNGDTKPYALRAAVRHNAEDKAALVDLDVEYTRLATHDGMRAMYDKLGTDDLRLLQYESVPFIGRKAVLAQVPAGKAGLQWITSGSGSAATGDLAYTYGLAYPLGDNQSLPAQSVYLHIWQRTAKGWRLLLDMEDALPPPRPH